MLGHVLEDHGAELRLVAGEEEVGLQHEDGLHGALECLAALPDGVDEPAGGVELLLDELHRVAHFRATVGLVTEVVAKHVGVFTVHVQLGGVALIHAEAELAVVAVHDEVWCDAVHGRIRGLVPAVSGLGVEAGDLTQDGLERRLIEVQRTADLLVMLAGEGVEMLVEDAQRQGGVGRGALLFQLQEEALTEVTGTDTGRLKVLNDA